MRLLKVKVTNRASVASVTYGRTGRELIAVAGNCYFVWSLESFELERQVDRNLLRWPALECLFLPGGQTFLEANGYWYVEDELPPAERLNPDLVQPIQTLNCLSGFLCFGPGGECFFRESFGQLWQSPQRLALWDFSGKCIRPYPVLNISSPRHAVFSPDGGTLAISSVGTAVLVDANTSETLAELPHTDYIYSLTFSADGRLLATSAGRLVRIWSVPGGACVHRFRAFRAHSECCAFSPDGKLLLAGARDGRARLWEVDSGRELADHDWDQGSINGVAFSPDGLTAAAACHKNAVVVWDIDL